MVFLRVYLIAGLLLHKGVWEYMKRQGPAPSGAPAKTGLTIRSVKAFKVAILLGLFAQTMLPDILPLSSDPLSLRIIGTILFTVGLAIALSARIQLGHNWLDIETAAVKNTQQVVERGIYSYIRHPIYTGDLLLLLGLELALNSWCVVLVLLLIPIVLRKAIQEERMLCDSLPGYAGYVQRTKRFIPFVA
jgi:protein-S-isoprenylcysteine O-methyltransferase Ste14